MLPCIGRARAARSAATGSAAGGAAAHHGGAALRCAAGHAQVRSFSCLCQQAASLYSCFVCFWHHCRVEHSRCPACCATCCAAAFQFYCAAYGEWQDNNAHAHHAASARLCGMQLRMCAGQSPGPMRLTRWRRLWHSSRPRCSLPPSSTERWACVTAFQGTEELIRIVKCILL